MKFKDKKHYVYLYTFNECFDTSMEVYLTMSELLEYIYQLEINN